MRPLASRRAWAVAAIVPTLVLLVFANQLYRVHQFDLSRWKGGGFGMFSTIDKPGSRFLKVYFVVDGEEVPIRVSRFDRWVEALVTEPTPDKVRALAGALLRSGWVRTGRHREVTVAGEARYQPIIAARPAAGLRHSPDRVSIEELRIEVWRARYEKGSGRITTDEVLEDSYAPL